MAEDELLKVQAPILSVVIPCYNEGDSLPQLFQACLAGLRPELAAEFVLVNNGSTDHSAEVLRDLLARPEHACFGLVNVEKNRGYGYGIMQGLRQARGEVLGWTHADLQTDPADALRAFEQNREALLAGTVLVKGARKGRPAFDSFFTAGMSAVTYFLLGEALTDINAQPKLFNRNLLQQLVAAPDDFSLDTYILYTARRAGLLLREYPVVFDRRRFGEAKGGGTLRGKLRLTKRTLRFLWQLRGSLK